VDDLRLAPVKLVPYPQKVTWGDEFIALKQLHLTYPQDLSEPVLSLLHFIAKENGLVIDSSAGMHIKFTNRPDLKSETYILNVTEDNIVIGASAPAGRYYALQTLRQLIERKADHARIPLVQIEDWPEYSIRGFMLDVGRNYQSIATLKSQLDIMARYKLNIFHWHLTDRPAWRIESKVYPELTDADNHRPTRDPGEYYTYDQIRELILYAKRKHITIIPEIDMPGHSDSFRKSMGVAMESTEGMAILGNVLNEFFVEIPDQLCPYIHIGSDEVRINNPQEFIDKMVGICQKNHRQVIVWNPGLKADNSVIRQTWQSKHIEKAAFREIDSWNNYINNGEPMTQVSKLFFKPIGFQSENDVIGGIICLWPDVNIDREQDAFLTNPYYPSLLTYAWTTWIADILEAPEEFYMTLPQKGTAAFNYFSAYEEYLMDHKQRFFTDEPFPYFTQCDKEWKLIGPFNNDDGDSILKNIRDSYNYDDKKLTWKTAGGNTLVIKDRFRLGGYYPEAASGQTVYALTYIHSDTEREVETMIGFETPYRANRTYTGIATNGSWDINGGEIWINNEKLPGPDWNNPGWKPSKSNGWGSKDDQEIPWNSEELYWTRKPAMLKFEKGWNRIQVKIPCSTDYQNWMFTFIPLNMEGIVFSREPE